MKLLDEIPYQDVDEWFEEQKELLDETMLSNLNKGANYEKEKANYDKKYDKLLKEFDRRVWDAEKHNNRAKKILGPFQKFKIWRKKKKHQIKKWWKIKIKNYKDKRFEKKYKKTFHIREKTFEISKKVLNKRKKKN